MTDLRHHVDAYLRARAGVVQPSTLRSERHVLRAWAAHMGRRPLAQLGPGDIERWLTAIAGCAPSTRRTRFTIVRAFLQWAVDRGRINRNPARTVPTPKVPRGRHRALRAPQTTAILRACETSRDRLIVLLGLQAGLRRAEIAALTVEDVDQFAALLHVTGKGGHSREVPIPSELDQAIDAFLADYPATHGALIRCDRYPDRPVKPPWVGRRVSLLAARAGVKRLPWDGVSTHALRHTAATDVSRRSNGNAVAIRDFLGHADLSASQVYVEGDVERLRPFVEGRSYLALPHAA